MKRSLVAALMLVVGPACSSTPVGESFPTAAATIPPSAQPSVVPSVAPTTTKVVTAHDVKPALWSLNDMPAGYRRLVLKSVGDPKNTLAPCGKQPLLQYKTIFDIGVGYHQTDTHQLKEYLRAFKPGDGGRYSQTWKADADSCATWHDAAGYTYHIEQIAFPASGDSTIAYHIHQDATAKYFAANYVYVIVQIGDIALVVRHDQYFKGHEVNIALTARLTKKAADSLTRITGWPEPFDVKVS